MSEVTTIMQNLIVASSLIAAAVAKELYKFESIGTSGNNKEICF